MTKHLSEPEGTGALSLFNVHLSFRDGGEQLRWRARVAPASRMHPALRCAIQSRPAAGAGWTRAVTLRLQIPPQKVRFESTTGDVARHSPLGSDSLNSPF